MIRLFAQTRTAGVQTAIASLLLRGDYRVVATPEVIETLRDSRLKMSQGEDLIDVLIRRLQAP